jgi:hypothetical protein
MTHKQAKSLVYVEDFRKIRSHQQVPFTGSGDDGLELIFSGL